MKVLVGLLLILLTSGSLYAQRAINLSNLNFRVGKFIEEFMQTDIAYANRIAPEARKTGANQTWDFSTAPTNLPTYIDTTEFVDPARTPFADLFPNATLAEKDDDTSFVYFIANEQRVELIGAASPSYRMRATGMVYYTFPFNFGQKIENQFQIIDEDLTLQESDTTTGDLSIEYTGYGTVRLPGGTFSDAVQLRMIQGYVVDDTLSSVIETIEFMDLTTGKKLAELNLSPFFGIPSFYYAVTVSTRRPVPATPALLELYPNPSSGHVRLTYVQREAGPLTVAVVDALGRRVFAQTHEGSVGLRQLDLNLDAPAGVYTVVIGTSSGSVAQKLVLH